MAACRAVAAWVVGQGWATTRRGSGRAAGGVVDRGEENDDGLEDLGQLLATCEVIASWGLREGEAVRGRGQEKTGLLEVRRPGGSREFSWLEEELGATLAGGAHATSIDFPYGGSAEAFRRLCAEGRHPLEEELGTGWRVTRVYGPRGDYLGRFGR